MFNHARGLWGYTGRGRDGDLLTVQSTGIGGPSAAIVVEELIALGARTLVRIGTCGALVGDLAMGELVVARSAIGADGTSRALGVDGTVEADAPLTDALAGGPVAGRGRYREVTAVTTDLFYEERREVTRASWVDAGAKVVEMETATLLALARRRGVAAGAMLAVTDLLTGGERTRMAREEMEGLGARLGEAAWSALDAGDRY